MIRQPTDIPIYFPTHQLTPSHIRIPFFKNFFFPLINLPPHPVYYQKIQMFYFLCSHFSVFCVRRGGALRDMVCGSDGSDSNSRGKSLRFSLNLIRGRRVRLGGDTVDVFENATGGNCISM